MRANFFFPVVVALALVSGTVLYSSRAVQAQTGPIGPPGTATIAWNGTGPGIGKIAAPKLLSPEALADYLRQQNHKVQLTKGSYGPLLLVDIQQNGWKFAVEIEYTPTLNAFYVLSRLGKAGGQSSAAQLAELLKANQKYGPSYFSIWPDGQLRLESYYGTQMDTAVFQTVLNQFLGRIQESHPLWDSSRWSMPAGNPVAQGPGNAVK